MGPALYAISIQEKILIILDDPLVFTVQLMISPPLVAFFKLNVATMTGGLFLQAKFEGKMTTSPGIYFILLVLEGERTISSV